MGDIDIDTAIAANFLSKFLLPYRQGSIVETREIWAPRFPLGFLRISLGFRFHLDCVGRGSGFLLHFCFFAFPYFWAVEWNDERQSVNRVYQNIEKSIRGIWGLGVLGCWGFGFGL